MLGRCDPLRWFGTAYYMYSTSFKLELKSLNGVELFLVESEKGHSKRVHPFKRKTNSRIDLGAVTCVVSPGYQTW